MLRTGSRVWVKDNQPAKPVHLSVWTTYYPEGGTGEFIGFGVGSFDTNLSIAEAKQLLSDLSEAIADASTRELVANTK